MASFNPAHRRDSNEVVAEIAKLVNRSPASECLEVPGIEMGKGRKKKWGHAQQEIKCDYGRIDREKEIRKRMKAIVKASVKNNRTNSSFPKNIPQYEHELSSQAFEAPTVCQPRRCSRLACRESSAREAWALQTTCSSSFQ